MKKLVFAVVIIGWPWPLFAGVDEERVTAFAYLVELRGCSFDISSPSEPLKNNLQTNGFTASEVDEIIAYMVENNSAQIEGGEFVLLSPKCE